MSDSRISADLLADFLKQTGDAHHVAFAASDGTDPDWATWYADHLRTLVGDGLGIAMSRSRLAELLETAQTEWDKGDKTQTWPEFYAQLILARAH
jgi:hypothetical protein